jgi:hypothetical protein
MARRRGTLAFTVAAMYLKEAANRANRVGTIRASLDIIVILARLEP